MKTYMLLIVTLFGSNSFAQNKSDFEKGYYAGTLTCLNEFWTCSADCTSNGENGVTRVAVAAHSKSEALIKLFNSRNVFNYPNMRTDCSSQLQAKQFKCEKL